MAADETRLEGNSERREAGAVGWGLCDDEWYGNGCDEPGGVQATMPKRAGMRCGMPITALGKKMK